MYRYAAGRQQAALVLIFLSLMILLPGAEMGVDPNDIMPML